MTGFFFVHQSHYSQLKVELARLKSPVQPVIPPADVELPQQQFEAQQPLPPLRQTVPKFGDLLDDLANYEVDEDEFFYADENEGGTTNEDGEEEDFSETHEFSDHDERQETVLKQI